MTQEDGDAWRHANIGRLLNNAVARFEARVMACLAAAGHPHTRPSHLSLTRNLDLGGTRVTELARRARVTKQAMSELVDQCQALGLVQRVADPMDARAKIVAFTPRGEAWLAALRKALAQATREMEDALGVGEVATLAGLLRSYAGTGAPLHPGVPPDETP